MTGVSRRPENEVRHSTQVLFSGGIPRVLRTAPQSPCEILVFEVEGQRHGIPAFAVREVLRAVAIAPLPGAPDAVEGMIDLRGCVVPVVDVRRRLGMAARPLAAADHLVVVESSGRTAALRVDRASTLVFVDIEEMRGSPSQAAQSCVEVGKHPDGLVLIHDLHVLLWPDGNADDWNTIDWNTMALKKKPKDSVSKNSVPADGVSADGVTVDRAPADNGAPRLEDGP